MRFQLSETVACDDTGFVISLLEIQLSRIAKQVVRDESTIKTGKIEISSSSILQNSSSMFSVRSNQSICLLTGTVNFEPSLVFWLILGFCLPTVLGWLIPLALYSSQQSAVRSAIEDVLSRGKVEAEFNAPPSADAVNSCKEHAEKGEVEAQLALADAYYDGDGVPQDFSEAARWTRKAADQGDKSAQYNLGLAYYSGEGVPQDYAEAARWFRKAAEQGDVQSQCNLGNMYCEGKGVAQDDAEGICWLRKAADQGDKQAQTNLNLIRER